MGTKDMGSRIVGVVGRNGSGKDEVVKYLHERCRIAMVSAGDVAREIAKKEKISPSRGNLHAISLKYMKQKGNDFFAKRLIEIIRENDWPVVGITGVRTPYDVRAFRTHFGENFMLMHVQVGDPELRFQRLRKRNEARDPKTWEAFQI